MPPGHWRVSVYERDHPTRRVLAWLGDSPPTPSDGGGGYEAVAMPLRAPVTVWRGRTALRMALPIVLGTFAELGPGFPTVDAGVPNMADRQRLVNMWRPDDPAEEPPIVKVDTLNDAVPFQNLDYVIDGLEWGAVQADGEMNRVMQAFTVTLLEHRVDDHLDAAHSGTPSKRHASRKRRKSGTKASGPRSYVVRHGDTLSGIAVSQHVKGGWRAIADVQHPPITDPRSIKLNQRLILP